MTLEVDEIEVNLVLDAIFARYGYDFRHYARASMKRRVLLAQARVGAAHLGELTHQILTDPGSFRAVLSTLTVQVTEMFRDPKFYSTFRNEVVPRLRTYPELKLWHAGCASGEEAYSMAVLMMEEALYERCQIYGTDLDASAIELAKAGVYSEKRAQLFSENYVAAGGKTTLSSFCTMGYKHVTLGEAVRKNVVFFQHDLATDFSLGEMHVILCRNVALYFDATLRDRVFEVFVDSLIPGGFLCLGASEALPNRFRSAFDVLSNEHCIFRRKGSR
jgi:chemotaxis protein methyltransferase CheR